MTEIADGCTAHRVRTASVWCMCCLCHIATHTHSLQWNNPCKGSQSKRRGAQGRISRLRQRLYAQPETQAEWNTNGIQFSWSSRGPIEASRPLHKYHALSTQHRAPFTRERTMNAENPNGSSSDTVFNFIRITGCARRRQGPRERFVRIEGIWKLEQKSNFYWVAWNSL